MIADLQNLINAIPTAQDQHVITSDYHNTLRAAVVAMATKLGASPGGSDITLSYAPVFLPITDAGVRDPEWVLSLGRASRPTGQNTNANGWFLVNLPNGARIRTLTVTGNRSGTVFACTVQLLRFTVADATTNPLINVSLKDVSGLFNISREFSGGVNPDFQIVDNSSCQYLIKAELTQASLEAVVDFHSFQIRCSS